MKMLQMQPDVISVQPKVWGDTCSIFRCNNVDVNFMRTIRGGFCSEHYHHSKYSRFFVVHGSIKITIFSDKIFNHDIKEIILTDGMHADITPLVWHKFEALEDSDVIEIYCAILDTNDIERRTTGGTNKS